MRCTLAVIALLVSAVAATPLVNWADVPMQKPLLTIGSRAGPRRPSAPSKCCLPDAFEVKAHGHAVVQNAETTVLVGHLSEIAIDKRVLKIAENNTVFVEGRRPEQHDTVLDDRTHKIYYINRERDCSTEHSVPSFEWRQCIPDEADYDGEERIGAGAKEEGVLAHEWRWRAEEPFEGHDVVGVTDKDCTPVWRGFSGRNNQEQFEVHAHSGYADFKIGVKNPSVFNVPKPCREVMSHLELSEWLRSVDKAHTEYRTKHFF